VASRTFFSAATSHLITSAVAGMRGSSQILIFVDVQKALESGIEFFLSGNGVVLTEGDERGFLSPIFFARVEDAKGVPVSGWENVQTLAVATDNGEV
jgi:2'-phosphotransferase